MGLDITAYRGLTRDEEAAVDADGYAPWETHKTLLQSTLDFTEAEWPGRTEGLKAGHYLFAEEFGFRAGSYGGYNEWRNWLARLAGYPSAAACWADPDPAKPFLELINFSDCEGYIGPVVAAKLAKDFAEHADRAVWFDRQEGGDGWWAAPKYADWRNAFELAADSGCVAFH